MNQPVDGDVLYEVEVPEEERQSRPEAYRIERHHPCQEGIRVQARFGGEWYTESYGRWLLKHLVTQLRDLESLRAAAVEYGHDEGTLAVTNHTDEAFPAAVAKRNESFQKLAKLCRELVEKGESE